MQKPHRFGFVILFGGWLCGTVTDSAELQPALYFPLAVGNRWVYESSESTPGMPVVETWEVARQEGNAFIVRVTQPYVTTEGLEERFLSVADGVARLGDTARRPPAQEAQDSDARLFLKTPLAAGASWQTAEGRYAVTAVAETVTVPAGTFTNCVEVTRWNTGSKIAVVSVYAPGVGMVRREETFPLIGGIGGFEAPRQGRIVLRLKEWTIKGLAPGVPRLGSEGQRSD
jgi:hypothetical protein